MSKNLLFVHTKNIDTSVILIYNIIEFNYKLYYLIREDIGMTFEQAFKRIKTKFENVDATNLQDMALQITFSDEDCGGTFYAAVKEGALSVEPYDYKDNDAVIDVTRASLAAILDKKSNVEKEVEKGALSVKGNLEKAAAFVDAIKVPEKKTTAKKTTVKKAAPKTTAKKAETKTTTKKTAEKKAVEKKPVEKKPVVKKSAVKKASSKTEKKSK